MNGKRSGKISKRELNSMMSFFTIVEKLKGVDREGWRLSGLKRFEHVGDHSYGVALISYIFAKRYGLDADKCMFMGLIHDLSEAIHGDIATRLNEKDQVMSNKEKRAIENRSMLKILRILPKKEQSLFISIWKEYSERKTPEAKLVNQVDKLDMILMLNDYAKHMDSERIGEFFGSAGRTIDGSFSEIADIYNKEKRSILTGR